MSGNWKIEHPDAEVHHVIYNHRNLGDISFKNDICPSFIILDSMGGPLGYVLYVDYSNRELRELPDSKQYCLCSYSLSDFSYKETKLETNLMGEVLAFIKGVVK